MAKIAVRNQNLDKNPNLKHRKKFFEGSLDFEDRKSISNNLEELLVGDLLIWKGQELSQDFLRTVPEETRELIAKDIYSYLKNYDWNKLKFAKEEIKAGWKTLCKFEPKLEIVDGMTYVANSATSGNQIYRHYFPNIIKVKGENRPSIYDILTDKKKLMDVIFNRTGISMMYNDDPDGIPVQYPMNICLSQITIGAKNSGLASMASIFKPAVAKTIYSKYVKPNDRVLDYSCGFGTRLLGLMSLQQNNLYCGYEPNTETFNNLNKMIKDFEFNAEIKCSGSETDDLFEHKFDFIFSSPSYFNVERYCEEETQSYNKYPEYKSWLENYWRKTVQNCKQMIKVDGTFAINIGGEANEMMQKLEIDMNRIIKDDGFQLIDTIFMKTSKSHLSGKKGKDKKIKLEGIFFYKLDK